MILTNNGHIVLAQAMKNMDFYLAWGTLTTGQWNTTPPREEVNTVALRKPVGIVKVAVKEFVALDTNGPIETDAAKWRISSDPTKYLYMKFMFSQKHNPSDVIYQLGIFTGVEFSQEPDAEFHNAADVSNWGKLLLTENIYPIHRNSATKEQFEYVVTF